MAVVIRDEEPIGVPTAVGRWETCFRFVRVPRSWVDGVVADGESEVDESTVTGESLPVTKAINSQVIGASVSTTGTGSAYAPPRGARTPRWPRSCVGAGGAELHKAPGQRLADRAAFWLVLAAGRWHATFLVWLAVGRPVTEALPSRSLS